MSGVRSQAQGFLEALGTRVVGTLKSKGPLELAVPAWRQEKTAA